ncbi:MAG: hypothetical protein KC656_02970 [Myxococcales bacterium]|nr:hypothetical protein [Myxococcales bacterium]
MPTTIARAEVLGLVLLVGCGGDRFAQPPLAVGACPMWADTLQEAGVGQRIVGCSERAVALVGPEEPVAVAASRWTSIFSGQGLTLPQDDRVAPAVEGGPSTVSQVWNRDGEPALALALTTSRGRLHTSLAVVP